MSWKDIVLRLRALLFPRQMDKELQEELQFHIDMQARKNRRGEFNAAEAKRQARLQFGSFVRATEECREQRGISFIEILINDVRFSLRMLRKSPGFTAVAVVTLAMAIGANAVVFGVMDVLILRPVNVPEPESLYETQYGVDTGFQSYPNYLDLRDRNRSFDGLAAYSFAFVGLDKGDNPSSASGYACAPQKPRTDRILSIRRQLAESRFRLPRESGLCNPAAHVEMRCRVAPDMDSP